MLRFIEVILFAEQLHFHEEEFPEVTLIHEQDCLVEVFEQLMEAIMNILEATQQLHTLFEELVRSQ